MKYSGHRKLLCELSKLSNLMLFTSSDTKRTLMHLFLFTNSAQRELVSICTQSIHDRHPCITPLNQMIHHPLLIFLYVFQWSAVLWPKKLLFFCGEWYTYDGLADAVVNFNFRAGSTFPVPVCTVPVLYPVQQGWRG